MKNILLIIFICLSVTCFGQIGEWRWASPDGKATFELSLYEHEFHQAMQGSHCSTVLNGRRRDCGREEDRDYLSINLLKVDENVYQGSIRSFYSMKKGEVQIFYNPINETLHFQLVNPPNGEHYIPSDIIMTR